MRLWGAAAVRRPPAPPSPPPLQPFEQRRDSQIKTHAFPTTSIGSFPQTPEIRRARLAFKKGQLSAADYEKEINDYMKYAITEQERIGIDVLVHGEPERTDMVGIGRRGGRWAVEPRARAQSIGHTWPSARASRRLAQESPARASIFSVPTRIHPARQQAIEAKAGCRAAAQRAQVVI